MSVSFPFCLHIFIVRKNVKNLVTRIFFQILEPIRTYKRNNGFDNTKTPTATVTVDEIIHKETIHYLQLTSQETKICTLGDAESVGHSITEFYLDTDIKSTYPKWFTCYEDIFIVDLED